MVPRSLDLICTKTEGADWGQNALKLSLMGKNWWDLKTNAKEAQILDTQLRRLQSGTKTLSGSRLGYIHVIFLWRTWLYSVSVLRTLLWTQDWLFKAPCNGIANLSEKIRSELRMPQSRAYFILKSYCFCNFPDQTTPS